MPPACMLCHLFTVIVLLSSHNINEGGKGGCKRGQQGEKLGVSLQGGHRNYRVAGRQKAVTVYADGVLCSVFCLSAIACCTWDYVGG